MSDIVKRLRSEQNPGLAVRQQAADALERLAAENAALLCEARDTPPALTCEHPASLLLRSAETGEPLYCELCDDKSGRRDAEQCEVDIQARLAEAERDAQRWRNARRVANDISNPILRGIVTTFLDRFGTAVAADRPKAAHDNRTDVSVQADNRS